MKLAGFMNDCSTEPKYKLELWFSLASSIELEQTIFVQDYLGIKQHCVRGSFGTPSVAGGTFRWSRAVQALCILFLRSRVQEAEDDIYMLQGEGASPASSLDYALSKDPSWLQDMFGIDAQGHSYARRLIIRRNPERKRPGPVELYLNPRLIHPRDVRVIVDKEEVEDRQQLRALCAQLELSWKSPPRKHSSGEPQDDKLIFLERGIFTLPTEDQGEKLEANSDALISDWEHRYFQSIKAELLLLLNYRDIFSPQKTKDWIQETRNTLLFSKMCGKEVERLSGFGLGLTGSERLGIAVEERELRSCLAGKEPLVFVMAGFGSVFGAILLYLKHCKGYNIEIISHIMYSHEIMDRIFRGDFSAQVSGCCLNMGTAARMMAQCKRSEFEPFMLLPYFSERLVVPRMNRGKEVDLTRGEWLFLVDPPGASLFHYLYFLQTGLIRKERNPCRHTLEDLATSRLMEKDSETRSLLQFPTYLFNVWYNDGVFADGPLGQVRVSDSMLYLHRSLLLDRLKAKYFEIAVRDAWMELKQGGEAFNTVLRLISQERSYLDNLKRYSGLHYLTGSNQCSVCSEKGPENSKIVRLAP